MTRWVWIALLALFFGSVTRSFAAPLTATNSQLLQQTVRSLLKEKDYLGLRAFIKREYPKPMGYEDWFYIRGVINTNAHLLGFDLVQIWTNKFPKKSAVDSALDGADTKLMSKNFEGAAADYLKVIQFLKKSISYYQGLKGDAAALRAEDLKTLYPFALQSYARALYGAKRYDDAIGIYLMIPSSYTRYRQVLFEKMWAAFRAGRVEQALGAIASQRSSYFSRYLSPEAYLIQIYIYKKLCRTEELKEVETELKSYQKQLESGQVKDWAGSDLETLALQRLVESKSGNAKSEDREAERRRLQQVLSQAFQMKRAWVLNDIKNVIAYASLAKISDTDVVLKPIPKLTERDQLAKMDLEVWPADDAEEWADEVGRHYFLGDSLCKK